METVKGEERSKLLNVKNKQVTWGHNTVMDQMTGAFQPPYTPPPSHTNKPTPKVSKSFIF